MSTNGITKLYANGAEHLARKLEIASAERDSARAMVLRLERMASRVGGFMSAEDQETLRAARALLVDAGMRVKGDEVVQTAPAWTKDPPPFESSVLDGESRPLTRKP